MRNGALPEWTHLKILMYYKGNIELCQARQDIDQTALLVRILIWYKMFYIIEHINLLEKNGCSLWDSAAVAYAFEAVMLMGAFCLHLRVTSAASRPEKYGMGVFVVVRLPQISWR
jgi:hypothetical protein